MMQRRRFTITVPMRAVDAKIAAGAELPLVNCCDWTLDRAPDPTHDAVVVTGSFPMDCDLGRSIEDRLMELATS